jgi:lipoprotein-anchoring transpeptidase ErfK/SrfK
MLRQAGLFLFALPVAAALSAAPAVAQGYSAPAPYYRSGPPQDRYQDSLPPPGVWVDDGNGGQIMRPPTRAEMAQGQRGVPGRNTPYPEEADAAAPPPPGFATPDGRPPAVYGHQLDAPGTGAQIGPDDPNVVRPPGQVGAAPAAAPQAAPPSAASALPPEERPEEGQPKELPSNLRRQLVDYNTREPAGTIMVDTSNTYLYLILGHGKALRYGIGVGREGFTWNGTERISRMKEWPDWFPPPEMIERQPYLPRMMAGGPGNPLGARALYLGNTLYRIHGTNQPSTIGTFVSSGCIRLLNSDIEDLFSRVQVGTRVVVLPGKAPETVAQSGAAPTNPVAAEPSASAPATVAPANNGSAVSSRPLPPVR